MTSSRNISDYGRYPLPTDTTKKYNFVPGTGWVEVAAGGASDLLFHAQDQKASGTNGGSSLPGVNVWAQRQIGTVVSNQIAGAALSSDIITLPAGNYFIDSSMAITRTGGARARLYNITDASVQLLGTTERSINDGVYAQIKCFVNGLVSLSTTKTFRLEYIVNSGTDNFGLGVASALANPEIYTDIKVWKRIP